MKKIKKILTILVLLTIIVFCTLYIRNNLSDFTKIILVKPANIVILILFLVLNSFLNGLVIKYFAEPFKIGLKFKEWFGLSVITSFYNMITPFKGGLAAKAIYLKEKHNFPYSEYLGTVAGLYVINFLAAGICGLVSLFIINKMHGIFNLYVTLIFAVFTVAMLVIIIISPEFRETKNNFLNKFIKVLNGWKTISKNARIIALSSVIIAVQIALNAASIVVAYHVFGIEIGMEKGLFLSSMAVLSLLIQVTPAGLGINEAIAVFSGMVIGITPAQALSAAILLRVVGMLLIFTLGPIFSYILLKHKPVKSDDPDEIKK